MTEQEQSQSQQIKEKQEDEKLVDSVKKEQDIPRGKESKESTASIGSPSVRPKVESDSIGTVSTIGSILNSTIVVGQSDNTLKDESTFKDPTKLLPNKPAGIPSFDSPKEIEEHFAELKNNRILLVDCFDDNILRAASYELVQRTEANYEQRLLTFEGSQLEQTDLHLGVFVNEKIGSGEKLIVVISLKSQKFLDSMFFEEPLHAQSIKEQLEKNNMMLVCFANSSFIQEIWREKRSYFHFPKWNIPFLSYLLRAYFNDNIAKSLEKHILQQRNYGLWDENNSDSEFYGLVYGYLRNGAEQLREEIEKREQYSKGESVPDFLKKIRTVRPKELIKDNDLITNTVLYVATFFPD